MADLTDLRNHLHGFLDGADSGPIATRELAIAYAVMHPDVVDAAAAGLIEAGLMREIDLVGRRRNKAPKTGQGDFLDDLFSGFSHPTNIIVTGEMDGRRTMQRMTFETATYAQVVAAMTRQPKERVSKTDKGVAAILARIKPHLTSPEMTMADGMAAADAADKRDAAKGTQ